MEGAHRTYIADFIRDPGTGVCKAGMPPANLEFRIAVERRGPVMSTILDNLAGPDATAVSAGNYE